MSPVVQWQSGLPFTLSYDSCGVTLPSDAPCQVNGNSSALVTSLQGFGTTAKFFAAPGLGGSFTAPGLDQIGNGGRNNAWGPGFFNSDMSIAKNIAFRERLTAQFRMDAFNALNHINYGTPSGSVETGGGIGGGPIPGQPQRHHQPASTAVHRSPAVLTSSVLPRGRGASALLPFFFSGRPCSKLVELCPAFNAGRSATVNIGGIRVGSEAPVVVQSMTNTDTADIESTVQQIAALARAGSELVRITVNNDEAAKAVPYILEGIQSKGWNTPIIGDFHYNGHLLLRKYPACARTLAKYRINPGNVSHWT